MGRRKMPRLLIVYDGRLWYTRRVASTLHDGEHDEMVYTCDLPLGGPYTSPEEAVADLLRCYPTSRKV